MKKHKIAALAAVLTASLLLGAPARATETDLLASETSETDLQEAFSYADLDGWTFQFSSGAGGWGTTLTIAEDGTFSGGFHDSEMGDTGDDYPNGSYYLSTFSGKLGDPVQTDAYTYTLPIEELTYETEPETTKIEDGVRYIYSTAYGLDGAADALTLYLPGKPVSELSEEYLSWVNIMLEDGASALSFYGLYNEAQQLGFSSTLNSLSRLLADAEERETAMQSSLTNDTLTQTEMDQLSAERYTLWDDLLNSIWSVLLEELDKDAMSTLTDEELAWISEKEAAVSEAGAAYEGGSLKTYAENTKAADMTKDRVYVLMEYLN